MKLNSLKFLLAAVFLIIVCTTKRSSAQNVTITALPGNVASPYFLAKGATNQVVFGFSITVPNAGAFNPGPFKIAYTSSLNGLVSASLVRVLTNNPLLATTAPLATYGVSPNGSTLDISSFTTIPANNTYYFYLILNISTSTNPFPANVTFSLPATGTISQNSYNGSFAKITVSNPVAAEPTYYFAPVVTYATPQVYTQGTAISTLTPTSSAGTTSYSGTLPAGLILNTSTGAITGTPTVISTATNYTITATNNAGSSSSIINITVNPPVPAISYATPQIYTQYTAISTLSPSSTGGPVATYTATLPAGLSIDALTGAITGTPTGVNTATNYTVTATNAGGSSTATINITVKVAPPVIAYATPQTYVQSTAISTLSPSSTGGTVVTYTASSLPAGLSISATTGAITGTPTTVTAAANYTITATNAAGSSTAVINITINPPLPVISYATPQTYTQNVAISTLSVSSTGGAVATYSATLPAGLSINTSTGAITGTPTTPAAATNYTVTATNVTGSSTATINIKVITAAPTATGVTQCGAGGSLTAADVSSSGGTYNWYGTATGGVAFQSGMSATYAAVSTGTYYVSYTYGGIESARTSVAATINPIVSSPYSGTYFSYPFNGNTNDVSSYSDNGANNGASLTTDRFGATNSAYSFNGSSSYMTNSLSDNNPSIYTISTWFNTTSTTGGPMIAMLNGGYADRILYMSNNGQVYWGLYPGTVQTINTTGTYNDGLWHHAVVTVSSSGSALYLDGTLQASNAAMTTGNNINAYWYIGYAIASGWTNGPTSNYFSGKMDDIAIYHRELSAAEVASSNDLNQIYAGSATTCSSLTFNAPTITGATYTWKDPNNATQTGQSVTFPGAVAGNYTLTVTGGPGGCSSTATITPTVYTSTSSAFNVPASIPVSTNTTVSLFSGVGSTTYSWNFGGGTSASGTTGQGPFSVQWSTAGVKTITLTATSSGGCVTTTTRTITVTGSAYSNYAYNRTITLNNATVGMSANVTDFPVLLSIQNNDLIVSGTCNDKIQRPTGPNYDFAFFDPSAASELYYQVESYNSTTGTLLVWVRIPTLYAATNNTIKFYYGSKVPSVTHSTAFTQNTWNADYQAVYHFNESAYSATTVDGTNNGRTATLVGFQNSDYVAAGKIGSCYTFGGTSGSSSANDMEAPATNPSSIFTLSAWVNTSNTGLDEKILSNQNASGQGSGGYKLAVYYGSTEIEGVSNGNRGSNTPAEPALAANTWYYVQGVYDGTTLSTYVNGVQYKKQAVSATSTFTNTLFIGIGESKQYPFAGMIDEPRVSTSAKSSDWIKMEYANQNNPGSFIVSTSAASSTSVYAAAITGELSYTWNGSSSTDPSVAANWTNTVTGVASQLPAFDGSATLVIPTGLSRYPKLTADISLYGLTIAGGASLSLNGFTMTVGCHIYNSSTGQILYGSTSTAGGITWGGTLSTQYYYGGSTGYTSIANMTVSNGGTVNITGGAMGISNMLTLTNGNLVVDNAGSGSLTMLSTATNSGSVAAIPTGFSITGNVNVQRYISGGAGTRGYRLLSSPVNINSSTGTGNLSLGYLNTAASFGGNSYTGGYTQGPGTGFTTNGTGNPLIYLYDETRPTDNTSFVAGKNVGVYSITGSTVTTLSGKPAVTATGVSLPAATSYLYYFVGSNASTSVSTSRIPDATTLTSTGYLNQGTVPFIFWKTGSTSMPYDVTTGTTIYGISQVGNPYASTINLNTLYSDNYNASTNAIGPAYYELVPGGSYVSYNASNGHVSDSRASQYIVSGQGFLAQATAANQTLTFKEDQKTAYSSSSVLLESFPVKPGVTVNSLASNSKVRTDAYLISPVKTNSGPNAGLHLQFTKDSLNFVQTGIYFSDSASDKYFEGEDVKQYDGGTPQVFLSSYSADSVKLGINTLADYGLGKKIRLFINAYTAGTYNISLADITSIDTNNYNVYLIDNQKKDSLDMLKYKTYSFDLNPADTNSIGSNRFVLAVDHKALPQYVLSAFSGTKVATGVQLTWKGINAGNYTGYTLQKLNTSGGYDSLYSVQSDTSISAYGYLDTHPVIGNNTYRLAQNGVTGAITYSADVTVGYSTTAPNGALTLYPNPAKTIMNVTIGSATINSPTYVADIYNSLGARVSHQSVSASSWTNDVSSYKLGIYVMQVKDTAGNIVGQAKFVKVN